MKCAAVICAAGAGSRMGQNKALCCFRHETFLSSIVHVLQSITVPQISPIVVVTGAQVEEVRHAHQHLNNLIWAHNNDWNHTHMLESLTCGLKHIPALSFVLHWPVDCIGVVSDDLKNILNAPEDQCAVLSYHGKPGHPIRLTPQCADIIRTQNHSYNSLKDVFSDYPRIHIEATSEPLMNCNDPQILADFMARHPHL